MKSNCRVLTARLRPRLGLLLAVAVLVSTTGCQNTSGSKIQWPWTKRSATVPAAPPGAFPPPDAPAGGGDPFLPPVAPDVQELPPPGSHGSARKSVFPDAVVQMGAPTPISLVSGIDGRGSSQLTRAFDQRQIDGELSSNPLLATSAPKRPFQYIILHHSQTPNGNVEEIEKREKELFGWDGCGYHFVVGNGRGCRDGEVEVTARWRQQRHGAHMTGEATSEHNLYGIGICMVGDFNETAPTTKQIEATRSLVDSLSKVYDIPAYRVLTHSEVAGDDHHGMACPGRLFRIETVLPVR